MEHPIGFNLVGSTPPDKRHLVASGVVGVFKTIWPEFWGPHLEYILYAATAALLDCENVTLLGVQRMLSDVRYRAWVVKQIKDPMVKSFWVNEFENYDKKFLNEAIAPIQNKVGQLLMSPHVRNILGQVRSRINARFMMDNGRIFIADVSKGKLGADKSNLLGAMLVTQFQLAAMSRADNYRTKRVIVDRERAPLIKEVFERYATGTATLDDLRRYLAQHNIQTRDGNMLHRAAVTNMLSNPFYYGHFRYVGEVHEGAHEPLISKRLADQVQAVLKKRYRWSPFVTPVKPKAFLGLLHCSTCGGVITAEIQRGHTYYRCTKKSNAAIALTCKQPYIREEALNKEISDLLIPYSLRPDWADEMLKRVKEEKQQNAQSTRLMAEQKRAEIEKINLRLQTLLDSFLDGIIDREIYIAEKAKGMSQKKSLEEQRNALLKGGSNRSKIGF